MRAEEAVILGHLGLYIRLVLGLLFLRRGRPVYLIERVESEFEDEPSDQYFNQKKFASSNFKDRA